MKINHLAVLVSFVWLQVLGFLWYGPLFGEPWMEMVGIDMAVVEANPPGAAIWISNIIATIIPVYILAWLFTKLNVDSAGAGALYGFLIGFGFNLLPTMAGNMFAMMPYGLAWITGGFEIVGWAVTGIILGAWKKYA